MLPTVAASHPATLPAPGADLHAVPARRYPHIGQMPERDWVELRRQAGQASALLLPDLAEEVAPARCAKSKRGRYYSHA